MCDKKCPYCESEDIKIVGNEDTTISECYQCGEWFF